MHPSPPRPSPSVGRRLRPTPRIVAHWLLAATLALGTGALVARSVAGAEAARARFGELQATVVAGRDLPAGHVLRAGDLDIRRLPRALLPSGTLAAPGDAVGRPLTAAVLRGEPLVAARIAPDGLGPLAALVPPGSRAVAVPSGLGELRLRRGDLVDVLATVDLGQTRAEPTFPVARAALVIDVTEDAVTIAVPDADAPRVAFALVHGVVTLALRGPR